MRKSNRPPEPGARGLLRLCCPCCGKEFGTYLHVAQMSISCRCGATISLERGLAPYGEVKKYAGWDNPAVPQTELHNLYGWHISDLKIYNQPKDIMCFHRAVEENELWCKKCAIGKKKDVHCAFCYGLDGLVLRRPPQSWCYVEERYYG